MKGIRDYESVIGDLNRIIADIHGHGFRIGQPVYTFYHDEIFIVAHKGDGFNVGLQRPNSTQMFSLPKTMLYALDSDAVRRNAFKVIEGGQ